tara:strand:+ start:3675 stop:4424 length:750 start_codon:yes stop_codon:yes gene_type:complete
MVERVEITDEASQPEDAIPATAKSEVIPTEGEQALQEGQRPDWLPEQFNDPAELGKAYAELRAKMDGAEPAAEEGSEAPSEPAQTLTPETLQQYSAKFFSEGLNDQDYAELERMGVSKELVGQYAAGQTALMDQQTASVYREVGGQQEYEAMLTWAGQNLQPQEIDAFNKAVLSGDQNTIMMATRGLHSQYTATTGKEANLIAGSTSEGSGEGRFESTAQVVEAMNDPRYEKDSAYRNEVLRKMQNSSL